MRSTYALCSSSSKSKSFQVRFISCEASKLRPLFIKASAYLNDPVPVWGFCIEKYLITFSGAPPRGIFCSHLFLSNFKPGQSKYIFKNFIHSSKVPCSPLNLSQSVIARLSSFTRVPRATSTLCQLSLSDQSIIFLSISESSRAFALLDDKKFESKITVKKLMSVDFIVLGFPL